MINILKSLVLTLAALSGLTFIRLVAAALLVALPLITLVQGAFASPETQDHASRRREPLIIEGEFREVG